MKKACSPIQVLHADVFVLLKRMREERSRDTHSNYERRKTMSLLENIHAFWKRFADEEPALLEALNTGSYEKLSEILEVLNAEVFEISGAHFFVEDRAQEPEMTFDTGPDKTSQLICRKMKQLAPKSIADRWIINDTLAPLSQKAIEASLQIKDHVYSLFDMTAFYTIDDVNHSFIVKVYCPGFSLIDNPEYKREMSIYLVELTIGEKELEAYVSSVDFVNEPEDGVSFCNLTELYEVIADTVEKENWKTYAHPLDIYTVFKPHQDFASDSLRKDMKIIFTVHPPLIEESLGSKGDVTLDLKDKDGEYGYIYYANPFDTENDARFRQALSSQIETILAPLHCANVIGGAIGKSYSYIDLILYDENLFKKAFAQIQSQLKDKVDLHYRSFHQEA